jgi:hypothetical protein
MDQNKHHVMLGLKQLFESPSDFDFTQFHCITLCLSFTLALNIYLY